MEIPEEKKFEMNWNSVTFQYPSVNPTQLRKSSWNFVWVNRFSFVLGFLNILLLFASWDYSTQYHNCLSRYDLNSFDDPTPLLNEPELRDTYGCLPEYRLTFETFPVSFGCSEPGYKGHGYTGNMRYKTYN